MGQERLERLACPKCGRKKQVQGKFGVERVEETKREECYGCWAKTQTPKKEAGEGGRGV